MRGRSIGCYEREYFVRIGQTILLTLRKLRPTDQYILIRRRKERDDSLIRKSEICASY